MDPTRSEWRGRGHCKRTALPSAAGVEEGVAVAVSIEFDVPVGVLVASRWKVRA